MGTGDPKPLSRDAQRLTFQWSMEPRTINEFSPPMSWEEVMQFKVSLPRDTM